MGHAMSQIQICFSYFVSSIKSDLLADSDFRRLNWKFQTSFALSISKTIPRSHRSLYHTVSVPINMFSFAQVTASIIIALLCLAKYLLLDKRVHPAIIIIIIIIIVVIIIIIIIIVIFIFILIIITIINTIIIIIFIVVTTKPGIVIIPVKKT